MAQKKITDLTLRSDLDITCNFPIDDAIQTYRVTGAQLMTFVKTPKVVSKITTYAAAATDEVILCSSSAFTVTLPSAVTGRRVTIKKTDSSLSNVITVARAGSDTIEGVTSFTLLKQFEYITLVSDGTATWYAEVIKKAPIISRYTSSTGTHTTQNLCRRMELFVYGAGGGGGAGGTTPTAGGTGGTTTFGTSLLTCLGGVGSAGGNGAGGAAGGAPTVGAGATTLVSLNGETGNNTEQVNGSVGGSGGSSPLCGAGEGGLTASAGGSGTSNTGSGGGGGGGTGAFYGCSGGGAGAFIHAELTGTAILSSFPYGIGAAGTAGAVVSGDGRAGGAGSNGFILCIESF